MNKNYKTLELDLILDQLAGECSCDDAKDLARGLKMVKSLVLRRAKSLALKKAN